MKRTWIVGIALAVIGSAGFIAWQRLDPDANAAKTALLADSTIAAEFGSVQSVQLVKYVTVSPSERQPGYRTYLWYVRGSKANGRVEVVVSPADGEGQAVYSVVRK